MPISANPEYKLISTIEVLRTMSGYSANDLIEVFYDTEYNNESTGNIIVELNGVAQSSGGVLLNNMPELGEDGSVSGPLKTGDPYYTRTQTGFTHDYTQGSASTNLSWSPIQSYPYVNTINTPIVEETDASANIEIRDTTLKVTSITYPTSISAADGSITVVASGTNSPFDYTKTDPRTIEHWDDGYFQASGTFSGLTPGKHTIYAIGGPLTNRKTDIASITVYLDYQQTLMDGVYGSIYESVYTNQDGTKYKTEMLEQDYTGGTDTSVELDPSPCTITMRGEGRDLFLQRVIAQNTIFDLLSETFNEYKEVVNGHDRKYAIKHSKWNGTSYDLNWIGYCTPSSFQDFISGGKYFSTVYASDRLSDLKEFQFVYGKNDSGNLIKGQLSHLLMLDICLRKLGLGFGYRVAINMFASSHTTTNSSPLTQTFVDAGIYSDGENIASCDQVVKDILAVYGAVLLSWEGYWYIIRLKELESSSVNYIEYTSALAYSATSSWSPRIEFKGATESTKYRWIEGAQRRIYTEIYKKVSIRKHLILKDEDGGILPGFTDQNEIRNSNGDFIGYEGYTIKGTNIVIDKRRRRADRDSTKRTSAPQPRNEGESLTRSSIDRGRVAEDFGKPTLGFAIEGNSTETKYIESTGYITYAPQDKFEIAVSLSVEPYFYDLNKGIYNDLPIYGKLKWSLRIGNEWINSYGEYSSSQVINEIFIDDFKSVVEIKELYSFNNGNATDAEFEFRVYPVDITNFDLSVDGGAEISESEIISAMQAITTVDVNTGLRQVLRAEDTDTIPGYRLYYFELLWGGGDSGIDFIRPTDYDATTNRKNWRLVATSEIPRIDRDYNGRYSRGTDSGVAVASSDGGNIVTLSNFLNINLNILPDGELVPVGSLQEKKETEVSNNMELYYDLNQFDLNGEFNNAEKVILNYLRDVNGDPTENWQVTGETLTKSIQQHQLDWMAKLTKRARSKVQGKFIITQTDLKPINVLYDPMDSNRIYLPVGVSSDFKNRKYSGELIELASGDDVTISAFDSSVDQNALR